MLRLVLSLAVELIDIEIVVELVGVRGRVSVSDRDHELVTDCEGVQDSDQVGVTLIVGECVCVSDKLSEDVGEMLIDSVVLRLPEEETDTELDMETDCERV